LNAGERFGVISTSNGARNAELRLIRSHGLMDHCAGMAPMRVPMVDIIPPNREALQHKFGLPVIDPAIAGLAAFLR